MKILVVIGTRPEAIKMAPVIKVLNESTGFELEVCNTGQHKEMMDQVLDIFGIIPEHNLSIMKKGQTLSQITFAIMNGLEKIFRKNKYDLILVHGDTTTCFSSSLVAFYNRIPIAHVEAGLRTHDIYSPWPEEMNRIFVGKLAKIHFAPTQLSKENLLSEGVDENMIYVTGNTVIDAISLIKSRIENDTQIREKLKKKFQYLNHRKKLILVTGHRRENFGKGLRNICTALKKIAINNRDVQIVYPVHLNPKIKEPVLKLLSDIENIFLIDPVDYLNFVYLMLRSDVILTDSGGVQEEAPFLGKKVVLLREKTERPEVLEDGLVKVAGTDAKLIQQLTEKILIEDKSYTISNLYGDGRAALTILKVLIKNFKDHEI